MIYNAPIVISVKMSHLPLENSCTTVAETTEKQILFNKDEVDICDFPSSMSHISVIRKTTNNHILSHSNHGFWLSAILLQIKDA